MVAERANERVCYFNGEIVPESRAVVSFRDRSFRYGDGAFDTTRTFGHRIFKLEEHIVRFYKTLRYLRIDPGMAPSEMKRHTEEVLARNSPPARAGRGLLGLPAHLPRPGAGGRRCPRRDRPGAHHRLHTASDSPTRPLLPRRDSAAGSIDPPCGTGFALPQGEDPQLSQSVRGQRRGPPPRPQCLGAVPRPQRQSLRGRRLQYLPHH